MRLKINTKYHVFAPMWIFQLGLIYLYFPPVVPSNICMFLSCRPFVVITTFSTVLVGVEKICWKCCYNNERPQDRNIHILDGVTVENKGKLILNEIKTLMQTCYRCFSAWRTYITFPLTSYIPHWRKVLILSIYFVLNDTRTKLNFHLKLREV